MRCYRAYLETGEAGVCMAHVPELWGCAVRASAREQVLAKLPQAIGGYNAWLRSHAEPAPEEGEPISVEVVGESTGFGPFNPGDAAALFPPDRAALTDRDLEQALRLMAHSRADLLKLVRGLPDALLDAQPSPGLFSVRRLLRHVGNAEEWYVSRLVPPEALPPEWEHDEDLALFDFLDMERRTAVACLRALTGEQRSGVFLPSRWTDHPDEPWTARKVLRRFLEHELEHTAQVRDLLSAAG